jgi:type I restriction enzyme S subunit
VRSDKLLALKIPLPSLSEQRRIACQLGDQLAATDRASIECRRRAADIQSLRLAVTHDAFSAAYSQWPATELGAVIALRNEIVHPRDDPTGESVFVGLEHISSNTGSRTSGLRIRLEDLTGRKARFRPGDIVYGYLRPYLNKVWLADIDGFCSVDQYVFTVDETKADPRYVASFMRSPAYLAEAPVGTTPGYLPRIRTNEVRAVRMPLPPLADQRRMIDRLETQLARIDATTKAANAQLEAVAALPAALLRRAFGPLE